MFDLSNKVYIITGGSGLLGSEFINSLQNRGASVVNLDIGVDKSNNGLIQRTSNVFDCYCDITVVDSIRLAVSAVSDRFEHIDGIISNAANNPQPGDCKNANVEYFDEVIWEKDLSVGLTGMFLVIKYFSQLLKANPKGGSLVFISSDLGLIAPNQNLYSNIEDDSEYVPKKPISYSVVKAGVIGMARYFATYWPNLNIRSNVICPGGVFNEQPDEFLSKIHQLIPLKKMANPDSYNSTLIWLLSDESQYVNGAVISVDGGRTVW